MEAEDLLDMVQEATHPHGHVLVHVVDTDFEYWLDIVDVKPSRPTDPGWVDGVVLEARPIRDGVRARRAVFTPRPFFQPALTIQKSTDIVDLPEEFSDVSAEVSHQLSDIGPREEPLPNTMAPGFPDDVHVPRIVQKIMGEQKPIASYVHEEDGVQVDFMGIPEGTEVPERFLGPDGLLYIKKPTSDASEPVPITSEEISIRKPPLPEPGITIHGQRIPLRPRADGEYTMFLEPGRTEPFPSRDIRFQQYRSEQYRSPFQQTPLPLPQDQGLGDQLYAAPLYGQGSTDPSEPHYEAARELNTRQVNDIIIENTLGELSKDQERARRNLEHQLNERSFLPRTTDTSTDESQEQ